MQGRPMAGPHQGYSGDSFGHTDPPCSSGGYHEMQLDNSMAKAEAARAPEGAGAMPSAGEHPTQVGGKYAGA